MDLLLTTSDAAALCQVRPATIRKWVQRGLLTASGLTNHGHPLYTQVDVAHAERSTRDRAGRSFASAA